MLSDPMLQINDESINCYQKAGRVTAQVIEKLVTLTVPGINTYDLCMKGDALINKELNKLHYKEKGIAFPTCISINNIAGHYSPSKKSDDIIEDGDLVKIELGVHVDGYPALICYTVLATNSKISETSKQARVLKAVANASKEIVNIMKPGVSNKEIVNIMEKYAEKYDCKLPYITENAHAPGVLSYQMSQYVIDGHNDDDDEYLHHFIMCRYNDHYEYGLREMPLEENEVYAIDIVMSSGTGKLNSSSKECTIYKRLQDKRCMLRLKTSKLCLSQFKKNRFPINARNVSNNRFKMGLKECINKCLIEPYTPMEEKKNEFIARVKFTVIVKPKPILISGRREDDQLAKIKSH